MSASNEKRERRSAERQREEQERKKYRAKVIAVVAAVVAMIIFVIVFSSNLFYSHVTAVNINGVKYTVADFNYYYYSAYSNYYAQYEELEESYGDYASLFMPMPSSYEALREQAYSGSGDYATWGDYFKSQALEMMRSVTMHCQAAEKDGFTLTDEQIAEIDSDIESLRTSAESDTSGYFNDLESYLRYVYGKGMTEKIYRRNVERMTLAQNYAVHLTESYDFTESDLKDYYAEHKDEYDVLTYRSYFIQAVTVEDDPDTEEDETVSYDDAMAAAEEIAKAFVAEADSEEAFAEVVRSIDDSSTYQDDDSTLHSVQGTNLSDDLSEWLLDSERKNGDTTYISVGSEDSTGSKGYYVLYFVDRDTNDYDAVSFYFMYVTPEDVTQEEDQSDEDYAAAVEAADSAAKEVLQLIYDDYEAGEQGYDAFAALYTANAGIVTYGGELSECGKSTLPDSMTEWLFDSSREAGEVSDIIYDETIGYIWMYYISNDGNYADLISNSDLRNSTYSTWYDETMEGYLASTKWVMRFAQRMTALGG